MRIMSILAAVIAFAFPIFAADETPERATFTTADGVQVVGDYFAPSGKNKAPVAILIHQYQSDRTSWRPLVAGLRDKGFAVLAYDIRGAGESLLPREKHLRRFYGDRDGKLFGAAWQDAEGAAKWIAGRKECDATRLVVIGASVGCSIAIDYAGRNENVRNVICLSPGPSYMGVDSVKQIRKLGSRPILLISPEAEKASSNTLAKADPAATVEIVPGTRDQHGTRMFNADYGPKIMTRIAEFAADHLVDAPPTPKAETKP